MTKKDHTHQQAGKPVCAAPDAAPRLGQVGADRPLAVLIAAREALARAGYRALLETDGRISVVGEAASAQQAVVTAKDTDPDVALIDLGLPDLGDANATARIVADAAFAEVAVMVLTERTDDERVSAALRAGAMGVLARDVDAERLVLAVQALGRGHAVLSVEVANRIARELPPRAD